eukprot:3987-Heterococcus_DN1.PRE.2
MLFARRVMLQEELQAFACAENMAQPKSTLGESPRCAPTVKQSGYSGGDSSSTVIHGVKDPPMVQYKTLLSAY